MILVPYEHLFLESASGSRTNVILEPLLSIKKLQGTFFWVPGFWSYCNFGPYFLYLMILVPYN